MGAIELVRSAAPEVPIIVLADRPRRRSAALAAIRAGRAGLPAQERPVTRRSWGDRCATRSSASASRSRLAHLALHDPLTGLPNRALFLDRLGVALDRSRRTNTRVARPVPRRRQLQADQRHARPRAPATAARRCSPSVCGRCCGRWTRSPASAATSSRSCSRTSRASASRADRRADRRAASLPIQLSSARRDVGHRQHRHHDRGRPDVDAGDRRSARPTRRCTAPRSSAARATSCSTRARASAALHRLELESALSRAIERAELRIHYQPKISLDGGRPGCRRPRGSRPLAAPASAGLIAPSRIHPARRGDRAGRTRSASSCSSDALTQVVRWRRSRPEHDGVDQPLLAPA